MIKVAETARDRWIQHCKAVNGDNKMKVKSMRIPEDIEQAIEYVSKVEKIEKAQSLMKTSQG